MTAHRRRWADIPARPFIGISDDDERQIGEMLLDRVTRAWDRQRGPDSSLTLSCVGERAQYGLADKKSHATTLRFSLST